jgi:hypothetical protein
VGRPVSKVFEVKKEGFDLKIETNVAKPTAQPAAPPQFLTSNNWTPDILAALLGMILGILLGSMLSLVLTFIAEPTVLIIVAVFLLLASWWFSRLCQHMELTGHRLFHQAYFLLMPLATIFVTLTLLVVTIHTKVNSATAAAAQAGAMLGFDPGIPQINPLIGIESIIAYVAAMAVIVVLPFLVQSRKNFHISWLLPLIMPIAACTAIWLLLQAIV